MVNTITVKEVLSSTDTVLLDVRSPGEYAKGHIPKAISFPLFTDEERAIVGTLYKQTGKIEAFEKGLEIVGPKMAGFVREARKLAGRKSIIVHCWRGGQRSGSMAWLLAQAGLPVSVMQGGYKAYRQYILSYFEEVELKLLVIGGKTGSGKTKILHELSAFGEQSIDLEGMTNHKGSAFGSLGEAQQPTNEQFDNDLAACLHGLDLNKRIWVENESKNIGRIYLPNGFWRSMKREALFNLELALESRLDILVEDYAKFAEGDLIKSFDIIQKRLGGLAYQQAISALQNGDHREAARIALLYYDKAYGHSLSENDTPLIVQLQAETFDAKDIAQEMRKKAIELNF